MENLENVLHICKSLKGIHMLLELNIL